MKHRLLIIIIFTITTLLTSCKKVPLTIGKTIVQNRQLVKFDRLTVKDDINVILVRSDSCWIEVSAGENIIDNITTEVSGGVLTIRNENALNWIRTYDYRIDVTLYFNDIREITYSSCGELKTKNQFNAENGAYLMTVYESSGDVYMEINDCDAFYLNYEYGTSQINLFGKDNDTIDIYKKSYGLVHAESFDAECVTINNKSTGDCWVKACRSIYSHIENLGNVYYKGEPDTIVASYTSEARGRLIKF